MMQPGTTRSKTLVKQIITLNRKIAETEDPTIKATYWKQIGEIDHAIDHQVYDLYQLTPGEIGIIEKAVSGPDYSA